jgi:hypothetical protein
MELRGIALPVPPRALGGMFSRSQRLWFSLLSKIINMSKLLSNKVMDSCETIEVSTKAKCKFGF